MALRSDQATVLRRRIVSGMVRALILFSAAFALACFAFNLIISPWLAAYVADSTSVWRTLDSSAELDQLLAELGLESEDPLAAYTEGFAGEGYSTEPASIVDVAGGLNELSDLIRTYTDQLASGVSSTQALETILPELESLSDSALATAESLKRVESARQNETGFVKTEVSDQSSGVDGAFDAASAADAAGSEAASATDAESLIDAEGASDDAKNAAGAAENTDADGISDAAEDAAAPSTPPVASFISYEDILAAVGINPPDASAAQGMAALRFSAAIAEAGLALDMPEGASQNDIAILVSAVSAGCDATTFSGLFAAAYQQSQRDAYDTWASLTPPEQAILLDINDSNPVWQVEYDSSGTYHMRDIATYTFVKSLKLPLGIIVFVAGWLVIMFHALNRSLRYFDDLAGAVGKLLADKDAPIDLPADLAIARNELAVIRSQSIADERAAKAAEKRKDELVAYLAHDIRTPLTSVLGYLDLLREATDLPRDMLRKYADIAYSKAERLERLINEFFEITRYNLSSIPIERETVGVRLFCQQVAESFFPEATDRNIRIVVDVNAADQFFIDPDKLARALGNILRNAVAYADANSTIALAARQDARFTTITVANRGREISQEHLGTIFEKFYREDGARSSHSGGAGLGLAIAKEIVVAHQGDISAQSKRGVTVFTLRVPTCGGDAASAECDANGKIAGRHLAAPGRVSRLNHCNDHSGRLPADRAVRDNETEPRRRGPLHPQQPRVVPSGSTHLPRRHF